MKQQSDLYTVSNSKILSCAGEAAHLSSQLIGKVTRSSVIGTSLGEEPR